MRALTCSIGLPSGIRQAVSFKACSQGLTWAVTPPQRRPTQASTSRTLAAASTSSGGNGASSAANGWLLDAPASSLGSPQVSSSSSSSSSIGATARSISSGPYDAIMMLGGGLLPHGGLPEWVVRRLEGCLHLYSQQIQADTALLAMGSVEDTSSSSSGGSGRNGSGLSSSSGISGSSSSSNGIGLNSSSGLSSGSGGGTFAAARVPGACPIVLLGAGTPHKPPVIDAGGYVVHESTAYADYLLRRGVPGGDLLKEAQSFDTIGNGYFSLLQHALPAGWRRIAVVTSDFHMPRTRATFDFVYSLAGRQLHGDPAWYCLDYQPVSDEGLFAPDVLEARAAKEAAAIASWQRNTAGMASLADLHSWLYGTHLCYSVSRQHEFGRHQGLDPKLAATY